jgi:hypothetical protein
MYDLYCEWYALVHDTPANEKREDYEENIKRSDRQHSDRRDMVPTIFY